MKILKIIVLATLVIGFIAILDFAGYAGSMMDEGSVDRGKALFNDPMAFGGSTSCSSCHPDGKGLEESGMEGKTKWTNPVGTYNSLEEAINICITQANKGKAIGANSQEMKDVIAYIKSLDTGMNKEMKHKMPVHEKRMGY